MSRSRVMDRFKYFTEDLSAPQGKEQGCRRHEKTKARKNAQIESLKKAARAEDMAKGVFIPVKDLPKKEPKVADMSASA